MVGMQIGINVGDVTPNSCSWYACAPVCTYFQYEGWYNIMSICDSLGI